MPVIVFGVPVAIAWLVMVPGPGLLAALLFSNQRRGSRLAERIHLCQLPGEFARVVGGELADPLAADVGSDLVVTSTARCEQGDMYLLVAEVLALVGLLWTDRLTATSAVVAMAVGPVLGTCWIVRISGALHLGELPQGRLYWQRLIVDGLSPMAGAFSIFLALRLNRIVLAVAASTHSLGLFTIAIAVPETLRILPRAVGQVIADRARTGVDDVMDARRHARLFMVGHGLVLAVAALVGWLIIPVVFGEGFRQAREVLVLLTVAEFVLTLHLMYQALLTGFGRPSGIGLPSVVGAVVMVVLNLTMIPAWGMQGAAWACLIGFSALAAVSIGWTNRELRRIG